MMWEYAFVNASMKRDDAGKDMWTVHIYTGLEQEARFRAVLEAKDFKRYELFSAMGVHGWEFISSEGEKVTYPGGTLGLGRDNTHSGTSFVRYIFKRPMERAAFPHELDFAHNLLGRRP